LFTSELRLVGDTGHRLFHEFTPGRPFNASSGTNAGMRRHKTSYAAAWSAPIGDHNNNFGMNCFFNVFIPHSICYGHGTHPGMWDSLAGPSHSGALWAR
jgi:hypothetical protein